MKMEPRPVRATSLSTAIGMDIPTALYGTFTGNTPRVATDYPDGVGWLWTMAYAKSLVSNQHKNRRDIVRVLRGGRRIKAFAEDFSDPGHWRGGQEVGSRARGRAGAEDDVAAERLRRTRLHWSQE